MLRRGGVGDRTAQGLAVTHQGVEALGHARLGRHPALEERLKGVNIKLGEQQPERGVGRHLAEIRAQQIVVNLEMTFGEPLHPHQGTPAAVGVSLL